MIQLVGATERKGCGGLATIVDQIVVPLNCAALGVQPIRTHVVDDRVSNVQCRSLVRTRGVYLQADGTVLQHRIIHRAFHAAVQPNTTALRSHLFNSVFRLELKINLNPPLPRHVLITRFQSVALKNHLIPQFSYHVQGRLVHQQTASIVHIHLRSFFNGQRATRLHFNNAIDDVWQVICPHFIARRQRIQFTQTAVEMSILSPSD